MNRLERLKNQYNIKQGQDLSFSKGNLSVEFYIDHSFRELDYIKPAVHFTDKINILHIYYKGEHTSYFQEIRELGGNDQFEMRQKTEEETIASIENILLLVFLNQDEYRTKAENEWIVTQINKRHFFCLGAILDTTYDPHKSERVFNPHKRLDKENFKVYEVHHRYYGNYNKKQDMYNINNEIYYFIKYDNNYVSDLYINKLIPTTVDTDFYEPEFFGLEIIFREDLTIVFRKQYDKNEHYRYFLNPLAFEITESYKAQIRYIYSQLKENKNHMHQAEQVTWNYRKLSPTMAELVDILFYFIENGIQFHTEIGAKNKPVNFSTYLDKSYENALNVILNNNLHGEFEERIKYIIQETNQVDEFLHRRFKDLYAKTYKDQPKENS